MVEVWGGGGMREEVEERMPPQSAPCRQTHVAVGSRVLVMTSENQQELQADSQSSQRRWVTTGENIICTDIKLTICNVFNHNYNALTTVIVVFKSMLTVRVSLPVSCKNVEPFTVELFTSALLQSAFVSINQAFLFP